MRGCIFFNFWILVVVNSYGQFEGKIQYEEMYISKIQNLSNSQLTELIGSNRDLFIRPGYYRNVYSGQIKANALYRGDVNRAYRYDNSNDTIFWMDASRDTLTRVFLRRMDKTRECILGLLCSEIEFMSKDSTIRVVYYFNEKYAIAPEDFKNHYLESWNLCTSLMKSVPLKITLTSPMFEYTSIAIKIELIKIDENVFDIPAGPFKRIF